MSLRRKLQVVRLYADSLLRSSRSAEYFQELRTYCMFVGYPRTGHSLIGSLLDAHPQIVIAHELDAIRLLQCGFTRGQVFHLLMKNSKSMAAAGRSHSGYSYVVPNQWQGRFEKLQVLGDKKGARSAMWFYTDPGLLNRVHQKIGTEIKFIHVIRNPYDVLATMTRRSPRKTLEQHIELFFQLCSSIERLKKQLPPAQMHDLRLESFIENPELHLAALCHFLRVEASPGYLKDCASIVFKSAKQSRFDIDWNAASIAQVSARMKEFRFLDNYRFAESEGDPPPVPCPVG